VVEELGLEVVVGGRVLREHEQARGVAVEAVDDADPGIGVGGGEVVLDLLGGRGAPFTLGRAGQEAGRFEDHDDVGVFEEDFKGEGFGI
jgi:hypothetical protein